MMLLDPSIVIIDEPTRGIDIGTKEQIYKFIADLAKAGTFGHRHFVRDAGTHRHLPPHPRHALVAHCRRGNRRAMTENEIVVYATGVKINEESFIAERNA